MGCRYWSSSADRFIQWKLKRLESSSKVETRLQDSILDWNGRLHQNTRIAIVYSAFQELSKTLRLFCIPAKNSTVPMGSKEKRDNGIDLKSVLALVSNAVIRVAVIWQKYFPNFVVFNCCSSFDTLAHSLHSTSMSLTDRSRDNRL